MGRWGVEKAEGGGGDVLKKQFMIDEKQYQILQTVTEYAKIYKTKGIEVDLFVNSYPLWRSGGADRALVLFF